MNRHIYTIALFLVLLLTSCEKVVMKNNKSTDALTNFNYLWEQIDEKYSYFDVKNIDWEEMKVKYQSQVYTEMSDEELFDLLFNMLGELKDGHVNLKSSFNVSRYNISHNAQENFNWRLIKDYYINPSENNQFGVTDYYFATGPLRNQILETQGKKIGYIYYNSFADDISDYHISYALKRLEDTDGLIFDVRNNGGGSPTNIFKILERFTTTKTYVYGSKLKNGPKHNDFGELLKVYCSPTEKTKYTKPTVVLTNRNCYSATSFFAAALKAYPNIIQIGDTTGGGAGAPNGGQLPNGWYYRFSVSRSGYPYGDTLKDFETGVPPDIYVNMNKADELNGVDSILETAINYLTTK